MLWSSSMLYVFLGHGMAMPAEPLVKVRVRVRARVRVMARVRVKVRVRVRVGVRVRVRVGVRVARGLRTMRPPAEHRRLPGWGDIGVIRSVRDATIAAPCMPAS